MASAPTLVLERLKTEFPQYAARGDQARSVAREIFHSERLVVPCKDTVELKLSVANVFSAAASAVSVLYTQGLSERKRAHVAGQRAMAQRIGEWAEQRVAAGQVWAPT